ncbi:hypothetical protein FA014_13555 [Cellulomonas hominis]|uniref:Glycosyltransferase RgtA/B/C/D-like domain-containing protein n=1 Tax=Cellulomonas hominis TaxID=156981 RepID=A0A7Z8NNW3_9CELL|nr:hypothetical protein [Cellulomonas hominis]TKR22985.1 hypothetical protein FA014_13555 [Cellulomonas hominis]
MASLASPLPRTSPRRYAADTWPARPAARWGLRVALALPFVAVALLSRAAGWVPAANEALADRGALVRWGDSGLAWIAEVFPPLSAALSSVLGGSTLAMSLLAAVVLGFTLQRLAAVLVREGAGPWATAAVLGTLVLTPPLYYLAANDLVSLLGLALLVLALDGIAAFVEQRSTEAGFRAGIALGVAVMLDPGAWLYALTLAAVAPFFARRAGRSGRRANEATVAVLLFPAAAALGFWLYASWWFSADPLGGMEAATPAGWLPGGAGPAAVDALRQIALALLAAPLVLVASTVRAVRDPWSLIAPGIAVVGLYLSLWLGLREAAGQTWIVLTALYVLLLAPRAPGPRRRALIVVAALVQVAIGWLVVLTSGGTLGDWARAVLG